MPLFNPVDVQWQLAPLNAGWAPFGGGFQTPQYARIGDLVVLRGAAQWQSGAYDLFTLPEGFRPGATLVLPCVTNNGSFAQLGVIALFSSGVVSWGGIGGVFLVSLDGVVFGLDP